jgi:hypothetical protein
MKKLSAAAIGLLVGVAVAAPASAQMGAGLAPTESPIAKQEKLKEEERKSIERDYDKTMKRLKNHGSAQAPNDPWATVRPAAEAKNETKNEPKKR